jgi:hypothetical protein
MRYLGIVGGALVALVAIGVAFADTTIKLDPRDNSGVSGSVVLIPRGNQTEVTIKLTGAPAGASEPANINVGQCGLGEEGGIHGVAYPLKNVVDGNSDTIVDVSLDSIATGSYAILVSESAANVSNFVTCGTVPIISALPKSGEIPLGLVVVVALTVVGGGFIVRRGRLI